MKTFLTTLKITALALTATLSLALASTTPLADQITNIGCSKVTGSALEYFTIESNCDCEETSGIACTVNVPGHGIQIAKKGKGCNSNCTLTLFRDDD